MPRSYAYLARPNIPAGEQWSKKVQNAPEFRSRLPLELALSYPVPGKREVAFFHYRWNRTDRTLTIESRVIAALPSLAIRKFLTSEEANLFPGLPDVVRVKPKPFDPEIEQAFYEACGLLEERFPLRPAGSLGRQWVEALEMLEAPELLPYYEALNPAFFAWCRGESR